MKPLSRRLLTGIALLSLAIPGFAALSPDVAAFGTGPAQWIMTKEEQARWAAITTDADAQAFIETFWARRDPSPGTSDNEFRMEFDRRVAYADEKFTYRNKKGSLTDRGRVLVVLGGPAKVTKADAAAPGARSGADGGRAKQTWTFEGDKTPSLGAPSVAVTFVDNAGDWRLERGADLSGVLDRVAAAGVKNEVTRTTSTTTTTTTATVPPSGIPMPTGLTTAALQGAISALKGGTSTNAKNVSLVHAEFLSPAGDYFTPIGLYATKAAGLAADGADTIFGVVEDASGTEVANFEQPVKLFDSNGDLLADVSLALPAGKYRAIVGIAKAGAPVLVTSQNIEVKGIAKDATGVSRMILSNNLAETADAAPVGAPFAFGKLKVVPKGNLVFSPKDDLAYFIEVHNPGIDPASNMPKLQSDIALSGGKLKAPIKAPLAEAVALPLSGAAGPGQYAVVNTIPLGQMSVPLDPGDYVLKVRVIDTVTKKSHSVEQSFKIQ